MHMQVLQGLRMDVLLPVSSIMLTPDMVTGTLTLKQTEASFSSSVPGILALVRQLEERLS